MRELFPNHQSESLAKALAANHGHDSDDVERLVTAVGPQVAILLSLDAMQGGVPLRQAIDQHLVTIGRGHSGDYKTKETKTEYVGAGK